MTGNDSLNIAPIIDVITYPQRFCSSITVRSLFRCASHIAPALHAHPRRDRVILFDIMLARYGAHCHAYAK